MSAFSDLLHGNFGNIGHDLSADPVGTGIGAGALALATGGLLAPELFGAGAGLFGAAEGAGAAGGSALLGAGELGGGTALGFAGEAGAGGSGGLGAIEAALEAGGAGGEAAPLGLDYAAGTELPQAALGGGSSDLLGAAGGGSPAAGGGGGTSFLSKLGTGAVDSITKNPLGIGIAGVGLGMNLLKGNPTDPNHQKLQGQADQLGAQGQALQQYLANGTLPPAMKASLDQATAAAKARIVANHAKNGMSTDPTQNSALAQELSAVDTNAVSAMATAQIEMMKTGLNATGLSSQLYEMLTKMDRQNNQDLMSAIQSFAGALGGGSRSPTIQLKAA